MLSSPCDGDGDAGTLDAGGGGRVGGGGLVGAGGSGPVAGTLDAALLKQQMSTLLTLVIRATCLL